MRTVISTGKAAGPFLLLGILLALPGPLRAQAAQDASFEERAEAAAAFLAKGTWIAGEPRVFLGGWGGLVFRERFVLGGGGFALTKDVELSRMPSGLGSQVGMGYAGVFFKYWGSVLPRLSGEGSLLFGAGHAQVRNSLTGQETGSDNFMVMEPEGALHLRLLGSLYLGAAAGYRFVFGVEDLTGLSAEDLRAFTGTLSLRLGGR